MFTGRGCGPLAGELQKAKNQQLLALRMQTVQDNPELTFVPRISKQSDRIATERNATLPQGADVTNRLVADATEVNRRR